MTFLFVFVHLLPCILPLGNVQCAAVLNEYDNDESENNSWSLTDHLRLYDTYNREYNWSSRFDNRNPDKVFSVVIGMPWGYSPQRRFNLRQTGAAVTLAIETFCRNGCALEDYDFDLILMEASCERSKIYARISDLHKHGIDVILGMGCSAANVVVGYFLSYHDIALFTYGSNDPDIDDKTIYDTIVRMGDGYYSLGQAFQSLFDEYGWKKVGILTGREGMCLYSAEYIRNTFRIADHILVTEWTTFDEDDLDNNVLEMALVNLKRRARIIFVCLNSDNMLRFFELADRHGMVSSDYAYFTMHRRIRDSMLQPWKDDAYATLSEKEMARRKSLFHVLKTITPPTFLAENDIAVQDEIWLRNQQPPFNWNLTNLPPPRDGIVMTVHDCALQWLNAVNKSLADGTNPRSGRNIFDKSRNTALSGITGDIVMNENADKIPRYTLWQYTPGSIQYREIASIITSNPTDQVIQINEDGVIYWGTDNGEPPKDTPVCGFNNELCPPSKSNRDAILIASLSTLAVLIVISYIIFLYIRKRKFDEDLNKMLWKVNYADLEFVNKTHSYTILRSNKSIHTMATPSKASVVAEQVFAQMALYKGVSVAIKKIQSSPSFTLSKEDLIDLKQVKDMTHENLNTFIGACVEPPKICILTLYCPRGSLQDVLENDDIKLDKAFKNSLISDLTNGMKFIHDSQIESHGDLRSSSCLIDSRWVLKVSNAGLHCLRRLSRPTEESSKHYKDLLWCAPELLRMVPKPSKGTQKGDIYSFAIIMHEILFRCHPYSMEDLDPKDIVEKVKEIRDTPFRPTLNMSSSDSEPAMLDLMKECWQELPAKRPRFKDIKKSIIKVNQGKEINILDSMVQKLEKYAHNLEDIVEQRTEALVQEKNKTDQLLYRMLPNIVAEKLKAGKPVEPEMYESATIYFSDIVGFTNLSSMSTPMQVVDLLNDLYTCFDDIIKVYDVYKVETIGDAYMCVSGIPKRNGNRHSAEIANMALALRQAVSAFKIRHMMETVLKIRIGIDTGPCAAGVVGLTMPRYCLFGDTVNTASRMESNSLAMKIHLSTGAHDALLAFGGYITSCRGQIDVKGKGFITTYWLDEKENEETDEDSSII